MAYGWLSPRGRLLARAGIGVLSWVISPDLVDEAVGDGLACQVRLRALPSRLGVYFVLGLCLFSYLPYGQVLRELTSGLEAALAAAGWQVPATTALTGVRRRVGEGPLQSLFSRLCSPLTPGTAPGSHLCGLLLVAWDGTTVAVPDSPANAGAFGKPGAGNRRAAGKGDDGAVFPQLRLVALVACGTRALLGAAAGPVRGKGTGERDLARQLLGSLRAGMLLLADRGFYSWRLWNDAAATGAHLLWRARADMRLPVARLLPDGSWLAVIPDPQAVRARCHRNAKRRRRGSSQPPETGPLPSLTVRVIEFWITVTTEDGAARTERYRMITTLTGWRQAPAAALAACYARRWAAELCYRELKTCLRGPGRVLRGRTPDLARQELWAWLAIYQAIRVLAVRAAARDGLDPGRISFTATLHAARRTITTARHSIPAALAAAEAEILHPAALIPERDGRACPRAVKQPRSAYPCKRAAQGPLSQHAEYTITITTPPATTQTTTHQARQPTNHPASPP